MYKKTYRKSTTIVRDEIKSGETIEQKVERLNDNDEPITDGAKLIYTDYKDGVNPAYDVRTDKWEIAMMERDKTARNMTAKVSGAIEAEGKESPETGDITGTPDSE